MSDTEKLLARMAAMEAELAGFRKQAAKPTTPAFDKAAFVRDPLGFMAQHGIPADHVTKVLVANAMGEQAPPELKVLAAMGPQMSHTLTLNEKLETLSRQFSELVSSKQSEGKRESWKALIADKTKYPHLAKAVSADTSLFDDDLSAFGGTAEELAASIEAKLAKYAAVITPPPASEANADNAEKADAQSTQSTPAPLAATTAGGVPPIPQTPAGPPTPDQQKALRDEIVRKYGSK